MSITAEMLQPLPGVIEPRRWTGTPAPPAEAFTIDCSDYAMDVRELGVVIGEAFERVGDLPDKW